MSKLRDVIRKMAWAGRFLTSFRLSAPTYWDTIEDIALRVWPNTQISIERKVVTIPTAASDSVALISMFPTTAASVKDKMGSDTPEIRAGTASLFIFLRSIIVFKVKVHNSKMDTHFG